MQFAQKTKKKECTKFIMLFCMGLGYRGMIKLPRLNVDILALTCLEQSQEMICLDPETSTESPEGQCKTKWIKDKKY